MAKAQTARRKTKPKTQSTSTEIKTSWKSVGQVEAFRTLSKRIASGEHVVPPILLKGQARREHVRSTLREDHAERIEQRNPSAREKFDELADDFFKFFRGTALLFYRDMVGQDAHMPSVLALGDVHPENFGVMPDEHGAPIFGVNDFDETIYAPFTWDLKRGAVGFWIAAREEGGLSRKKRRKVVKAFIKGYLEAMKGYAERATEKNDNYRMDNSPKVIQRLFEEAWEERKEWLWDDYLKPSGRGFRASDELQPISNEIDKFQKAIDDVMKAKKIEVPDRAGELKVKDVCKRHGQGTASLGLPRYYVLIEGPSKDATDDLIIEFKRARRSALEGLTPPSDFNAGAKAERIAKILAELFPMPEVPLSHRDPYSLLIAVLLSAQCTDERVNQVTPKLFERAATPQHMSKLTVPQIRRIIHSCGLSPTKAKLCEPQRSIAAWIGSAEGLARKFPSASLPRLSPPISVTKRSVKSSCSRISAAKPSNLLVTTASFTSIAASSSSVSITPGKGCVWTALCCE